MDEEKVKLLIKEALNEYSPQIIRFRMLEFAERAYSGSGPIEIIKAAKDFENYVNGKDTEYV